MTENLRSFYVYAFLRSADSSVGPKYSPYYIGKGKEARAYSSNGRRAPRPADSSFIVFIQEGLTENEAFILEKYCIALYGRLDLSAGILRNMTDGGEGRSGGIVSEEMRRRIAEAQRGEKHYLWGKHLSEEIRQKISEAIRGDKHPYWGKTHSQESREKMSKSKQGENNNRFGTRHSQDTKQKMSKAKAKYLYELIDPNGDVYITENLLAFSRQYGLASTSIHRVINGKSLHHKGWTGQIVKTLR
jgi:group I intron endonuclease